MEINKEIIALLKAIDETAKYYQSSGIRELDAIANAFAILAINLRTELLIQERRLDLSQPLILGDKL